MPSTTGFRRAYGAGPLHLVTVLASFALLAGVLAVWGLSALWDSEVWWQSVLVWFLGAVVLHDFVLFPLYALADRLLGRALRTNGGRRARLVPVVNHIRIPVLAVGLLFLLFFPSILQQGAGAHLRATGMTQEPFLLRWVLLSVGIFAASGLVFAVRLFLARRRLPR